MQTKCKHQIDGRHEYNVPRCPWCENERLRAALRAARDWIMFGPDGFSRQSLPSVMAEIQTALARQGETL